MTTSEHADYTPNTVSVKAAYIAAGALGGQAFKAAYENGRARFGPEFDRWFAALASTPSPAQPTEANEREALAKALFDVRDDEFDTDEWSDLDSVDRERWETYADAALAAGFRLAPSPVQGADDRLAQADPESDLFNVTGQLMQAAALIASIERAVDSRRALNGDAAVDNVRSLLATYQQSPQAALNEVQKWRPCDNTFDCEGTKHLEEYPVQLRARAAELRAAPQTGADK